MRRSLPGVRFTPTAIRAYVKVGTQQVQQSFPGETPLVDVLAWREEARRRLSLQHGAGPNTLTRDSGRYLNAQRRARRRSAETWLAKWVGCLGDRRRASLSYEDLREAMNNWQSQGYAASSLNKLRTYFIALWRFCEGSTAHCPMLAIRKFREPAPTPRAVDPALWERAFAAMHESKAKAHLLMIRQTGARPSEIARLRPEDLHLDDPVPWIFFTTGKAGDNRVVPLNRHGVEAARLFIDQRAFGPYSMASARKALLRACEQAGIPESELVEGRTARGCRRWRLHPYVGRHQCLTELRRAGADLADVQAIAGHRSPVTTARYAPAVFEKLAAAMRRVEEASRGRDPR